jgi:hypothetical protein
MVSDAINGLFPAFFAQITVFKEGGRPAFKNVSYLCVWCMDGLRHEKRRFRAFDV